VEPALPGRAVAYRLALKFGMRRGEILALELADVGDDIHVRRNAVAVGSQVVVGKPKSRAGDRTIPLDADPDMPAALRRHRKRQAADRLVTFASRTFHSLDRHIRSAPVYVGSVSGSGGES
jgi:integrase